VTGITSRFQRSDGKSKKNHTVVLCVRGSKPEQIEACCSCKVGQRTIGGCAHTTAALKHLFVNEKKEVKKPSSTAQSKFKHVGDLHQYLAERNLPEIDSDDELEQ
jgi:hypothetical protein